MSVKKVLYIGNKLAHTGSTPTSADILPGLLEKEGYIVYSFSAKENKILRLLDMLKSVLMFSNKVDWIIIDVYSTQNFWYAYLCGMLSKMKGVQYINILHGGNLEKRLRKRFFSFFQNAKYNIAPSEFFYSKFSTVGLSNLKFIPNSIKLDEYNFKERFQFAPKIIWVRAFAEIYNPMLAIQLLELLVQKYGSAALYMVGPDKDGSMLKCKNYAEINKLPITFTGKLDKKQWHKLAAECDIFLNTSTIDNTPVSIVEAMALGLPVLSSKIGGIPYLIEDGKDGILFESNNLKDLADKTFKLLDKQLDANTIAKNARKKVEKFDWKNVKDQWNDLLT
ncbi:glycosyltransferase family 4 protein [Zunongwangia sp. HGR-M22]|uniref:glycosyltransferase family 4 protein n=1 Tax=Zunongwangia sp. HGR-M22 TaxID=3015168 RepID=UPI0022DE2679|nr:glycosyltransferase family 4 protein [Zunongwangia sp. HGR-M22]WBL24847.1 glycosyltransferase family 4 protein [Zunongwangia sp. HGR-M22]